MTERKLRIREIPDVVRQGRRQCLMLLGTTAAAVAIGRPAYAQRKTAIRIVIPFTPGGPTDLIGRVVAQHLENAWGQPVVAENKPGAGSSIGAQFVSRATPDGNTLLLTASSHIMSAPLLPDLPYDPVADFTPLSIAGFQPFVLTVAASDKITDLAGFLDMARKTSEPISLGVAGIGNGSHYAGLMMQRAQRDLRFLFVPYTGSSQVVTSLLSGQVRTVFLNTTVAIPLIQSGRARALAVTSPLRWRQLPSVPTLAQSGFPGFDCSAWYGFLGPAGMPPTLIERLDHDLRAALDAPDAIRSISNAGLDPLHWTPAEFGSHMREEYARWRSLIADAGYS